MRSLAIFVAEQTLRESKGASLENTVFESRVLGYQSEGLSNESWCNLQITELPKASTENLLSRPNVLELQK